MNIHYIPIIIAIASTVFYHLALKAIPPMVNPITSLIVTYLSAAMVSILVFFIYPSKVGFLESFKGINWSSYILALSIVGIEIGFLLIYRIGGNVASTALFINTTVVIFLVLIGFIYYHEKISFANIAGILLCIIGIILVKHR